MIFFLSLFLLIRFHFSMQIKGPILFYKLDMNGFSSVERGSRVLASFIVCIRIRHWGLGLHINPDHNAQIWPEAGGRRCEYATDSLFEPTAAGRQQDCQL